jgi:putative endonuclease
MMPITQTWYIYIVQCSDKSLYVGYTNDVFRRIENHNAGRGAKYTRSRRPVQLIYSENYRTKSEAMRREWEIKQLTRRQKCKLTGLRE